MSEKISFLSIILSKIVKNNEECYFLGGIFIVLVIFSLIAWLSVSLFIFLPSKLTAVTNVLIYFVLAIIDINKLTIISYKYQLISISKDIPHFLSVILHRDVNLSFILLIMVNIFFTIKKIRVRINVLVITFIVLLTIHQLLRYFEVITYHKWSIFHDMVMIISLIFITIVTGYILIKIGSKESTQNG